MFRQRSIKKLIFFPQMLIAIMPAIFCLLVLLFPAVSSAFINGGDQLWAYRDSLVEQNGKPGKQNPVASVSDSQGNIIITGSQLLPGSSFEDIYTIKINANGTIAWRAVYTVPGLNARAVAVVVDASDNVYVTGVNDGSNNNIHTIRYNRDQAGLDATPAWQQTFDGGGTDKAAAITVSGNIVYVGGSSRYSGNECFMVLAYNKETGVLSWQIPNASTSTIGKANSVAADANSVAVTGQSWNGPENYLKTISYNPNGQSILWQTAQPDAAAYVRNDFGLTVQIDSKGHVVVAGTIYNGLNTDIHTVKYCGSAVAPCDGKSAGDVLWQQTYDGGSDDDVNAMQLERGATLTDDVYVSGHSLLNGRNHIYTARYKSAATTPQESWHAVFNSGGDNTDIPAALVVDPAADNLFIAGYSADAAFNSNFRAIKYRKSTGDELWTKTFHGVADATDRAIGAGLDPSGNLNVAGYADETAALDGGIATATAGTKGTLVNGLKTWTSNAWAGYYLKMLSGVNNTNQFRQIQSNDATTLNFSPLLPDAIVNGDSYHIYDKDDYDLYAVKFDKGILNAPTRLVASGVSGTAINLSWQDNNAVTPKFRVERCTAGTEHLVAVPCDFENSGQITVIDVTDGATSTQAAGLTPDKYYYFRVMAYLGADFASATQVTYPSSVEHAVTQTITLVPEASAYSYAGVANSDDYALTIATGPKNGHPVVSGKSLFTGSGFDYYTIRLDKDNLAKLWSQRYNGPEGQGDAAMCLAVDKNDQVIVSGYSMLYNLTASKDMNSIYTIKYKADALSTPENDEEYYDWSHQYNGAGAVDDRPIAIAAASDASNNVAVVGMGVHSEANMSNRDIYVLHYPPAGPGPAGTPNPGYWAATAIEKGDDDEPTAVTIDPSGDVLVTGFTMNTTRERKDYDIYTAKFAAATGALLWERIYDAGFGDDEANSIAADANGNVYVTGFATNSDGNRDYITIKYDRDGAIQWGGPKLYDGPGHGDDEAVTVKIDPMDNHVVISGNRLTDAGNNDVHTIRYAPNGDIDWQKTLLREHNDEEMFDMAIDTSGSVYIAATTTNDANSDPLTNQDILVLKLDWLGNMSNSVTTYGQAAMLDKPYGIAVNYQGDAFIAGISQNAALNADYIVLKVNGDTVQSPYPMSSSNPAYTSVKLDWTDSSKAEEGYQVARRDGACPAEPPEWLDGEIITTGPAHLPANTVTFTDTGRTSRATYCYGVRAFSGTTYSRWTNNTVIMATPPAPAISVAAATTKVTVSWTPQNGGQQNGYELWRCSDSTSSACTDYTLLTSALDGTATSYDDQAVCAGTIYRYQLKAKGTGWESDFSTPTGAIPPAVDNLAVDPGFEAPNPMAAGQAIGWTYVGGAVATDITFDTAVKRSGAQSLNINAVGTASISGIKQYLMFAPGGKYQISAWFKTAATAGKATCDLLDAVSGSFTNSGTTSDWEQRSLTVTASTTPYPGGSRIRCYVAAGAQANIDDLQATPLYDLTATRYSETQIDLAWLDSSFDETGYKVERCTDAGCTTPQLIATLGADVRSYRDNSLTPDTNYWYRIRPYKTAPLSCNGGWNGGYSNTATAVTTNNPPVLSGSSTNTTAVNLIWSDTANTENLYQIERCLAASCSMTNITTLLANTTTYSDANVCSNTVYNYQVRAISQPLSFGGANPWTRKVKLDFGATFIANKLTRFTVNQLTGMDASFKDIRFYDETAKQELPHWIEPSAAGTANVWIKTGNNNDIYLYFGNSTATSTSSSANVFGSGLVGFWPFNETAELRSGTTADISGNALNATLNYFYSYVGYGVVAGGRYKNGLNLGAHSYSSASVADTTGSLLDITDQITIELWYQYQKSPDWARLVSKMTTDGGQPWEMYGLWLDNSTDAVTTNPQQRIYFGIGSQDSPPGGSWPYYQSNAGPQLTPGQWYHIVGRYDSATGRMSVFVNGVEYGVATHGAKPKIIANNASLYIGNRGTGNYMKGMLDEVRLFNRALTDEEIASRYAATLPVVTTPVDGSVAFDAGGYTLPPGWNGPYSKPSASAPAPAPSVVITPKPANLVADPDFNNAYTSWATAVGTTTGTSFDTSVAYSGGKSLKFAATGAVLGVLQNVTVVPNTSYTLSGYLKTALTGGKIQCDVTGTGLDSAGIASTGTTGWTYKTDTITIPNGTTSVSIRCFGDGTPQGSAWIDMVQFVPDMPVANFSATRKSEEQADLVWTYPTGGDQTGFKIDRCTDAGCGALTTITALNADAATATPGSWKYSDKNLAINSSYWYRVRAYKTEDVSCNGGKGYWETVSTPISGAVSTALNVPGTLAGTPAITTACEDLRITDTSGVAQKFYLENSLPLSACNTRNTKLIVKVSSIPTAGKTLNLYYGNLKASRGNDDGSNVFNFFDDFNGTAIDTTKWRIMNGTGFSVSNGYLHGTNTWGRLGSVITTFYTSGWNLQAKVKSTTRPSGGYYPIGFSLESNHYRSFGLIDYPSAHHYSNNNDGWVANATTPPAGSSRDDNMVYSVILKSSSLINAAIFDIDKNATYWAPADVANTNHTGDWNITIGQRYDNTQTGQAYVADWDWVRIRKYVDNAPVAGAPGTATPGAYSLTGESSTWRFLSPVAVSNGSGAAQTDYQINLVADTTTLATDRNALSWTASTDTETGFVLERCKNTLESCTANFVLDTPPIPTLPPKNSIGSQVTYTDRELQLDSPATAISYCYRVKAIKTGGWLTAATPGETGYSNIACMTTKLQAAPSNFTATATGTAVNLSWTDNTTGEHGFTLERCQDTGGDTPCAFTAGNKTTIALPPNDDKVSTTATYTDPNLCAGTYRYRISVYKNNPDGTSWTMGPTYQIGDSVATDLPPTPENLVAARVSENQIRVTWKDMTADETGFEVWRCAGSTCTDFVKLPVTVAATAGAGATTTYNDNYYIVPETTYRYKVRAYVIATCTVYSSFSADNSAAAPNGPDYATASSVAPSAVTATAISTTQADLGWTDNTVSKSNIIIGRCPGTAPCQTSYTQFTPLASSAVTYSDTSVCADTMYNYQIYPTVNTAMTPLGDGQIWRGVSPLTISNFQPNFITQVVITKGTMDIQDDFRNIRFIDRDAKAALPYWIQSTTGTGSAAKAIVWFKTGTSANIDLYYGNSSATSASSKDAVFGTGLVGYWPFEEAPQIAGTIYDVSGSANNLTMTGFSAPDGIVATGKIGNALSLDGNGDYAYKNGANTNLPAGNPTTASAEAWVYPSWDTALPAWSSGGYRPPYDYNGIVSWGNRTCNGGGFAMSLTANATPQFAGWCNDYVSSGSALVPNTWNHLAVVVNGTSAITYYVNGTPVSGTLTGNVPLNLASTNLVIGGLQATSQYRNFKGKIDEVRIYNRALTAQDIAARYAATPPSVTVGANSATGTPGAASTINLFVPHSANLIANGEFDGTLSTKWSAWPDWNNITQDSATFHSGGKAVKLSKNLAANSAVTIYQSVTNLIPGGRYILTGSINASLASSGDSWCRLANGAAAVNYYSPSINITAADAAKNNQGWFRLSTPITLPLVAPGGGSISTLNLECGIWTTTAGTQTAYFDAVQLVPDPPIALTAAQVSEVDVDLNWNDLFSDETGFNIYRCQGAGCTPSVVVKQLGPGMVKYRDTGLTPGESYSYKVTAYKTATCAWESTASEVKTVSTAQIAPDLLSVTPVNSTKMRLTWTDMTATETGFNIERCEGASCTTGSPVYTEIYHNISPAKPLEESLKARYTFNGNINDSSASGLNLKGYYNAVPSYDDGGLALVSDANFTTLTTSNILDSDYYTIEFDIKYRPNATNTDIMRFAVPGANYSPGISNSSNRISWYNYPSGAAVTFGVNGINGTPFAVGNWYHIRGVKNGNSLKIYVDENLVATATVSNPKTPGSGTLYFGNWYTPDVVLKNVSIYNTSNAPALRTFDDNQVCPGTTYYYRISANKQDGWGQGPVSNVRDATTMAFNAPRTPFTATTVNDVQINLSWVANTENDQESFILKECPGASCADGMSIPNNTTLSRTGLTPETNYCYQVASWKSSAYCNGGAGLTSPFTSAASCPTTHTARAGNLTARALNANKIQLEWDDLSGDEDKFLIQRKIWNGQWILREVSAKTTGTGTKHTFIDTIAIEPLKKYTYRIVAVKGAIESPPSNEAIVTYTNPDNGQTISTTPVFSGGMDKATCVCTVQDGKEVCK